MGVLDIFDRDDELRAAHQAKVKAERADKRAKYNRSESKLQKDIFDAIVKNGYLVIRVNSSVHMTEHGTRLASYRIVNTNETAGLSDGIVFHSHGAVFVEIKKPGAHGAMQGWRIIRRIAHGTNEGNFQATPKIPLICLEIHSNALKTETEIGLFLF